MKRRLSLKTVIVVLIAALGINAAYADHGCEGCNDGATPKIIPELGEIIVRSPVIYAKVVVNPGSPANCVLNTIQISLSGASLPSVATGEEFKMGDLFLPIEYKFELKAEVPNEQCEYSVIASDENHNTNVILVDDIVGADSPAGTISFDEVLSLRSQCADSGLKY